MKARAAVAASLALIDFTSEKGLSLENCRSSEWNGRPNRYIEHPMSVMGDVYGTIANDSVSHGNEYNEVDLAFSKRLRSYRVLNFISPIRPSLAREQCISWEKNISQLDGARAHSGFEPLFSSAKSFSVSLWEVAFKIDPNTSGGRLAIMFDGYGYVPNYLLLSDLGQVSQFGVLNGKPSPAACDYALPGDGVGNFSSGNRRLHIGGLCLGSLSEASRFLPKADRGPSQDDGEGTNNQCRDTINDFAVLVDQRSESAERSKDQPPDLVGNTLAVWGVVVFYGLLSLAYLIAGDCVDNRRVRKKSKHNPQKPK